MLQLNSRPTRKLFAFRLVSVWILLVGAVSARDLSASPSFQLNARDAAFLDDLQRRGQHDERRTYLGALALNLVLNGSWSWVFFNRRWLGASAVTAGALAISSADLTRRSVAARGVKAAPMAAYAAWTAFATALSTHIWVLNRR